MKLSVIFGVSQMALGIICKGLNALHHKSWVDLIFEFLPQFLFLFCIFGYMDIMIFIKWLTDWSQDTANAPFIVNIVTNIGLKVGDVYDFPLWGNGKSQTDLNRLLLAVSLIWIPLMLFVKPIFLNLKHI